MRLSPPPPLTLDRLHAAHLERGEEVRRRLDEFSELRSASDERLLEELAFCIFAAGSSAEMGLRSVERVRPLLLAGTAGEMAEALRGLRFPNVRSSHIFSAREYLRVHHDLRLRELLESFRDPLERRRYVAETREIRGIGYKEASHFLRNVGYRGYAILDKHILRSLRELGVLESADPPRRASQYLDLEARLQSFAASIGIDADELDLLLWSEKTGRILK